GAGDSRGADAPRGLPTLPEPLPVRGAAQDAGAQQGLPRDGTQLAARAALPEVPRELAFGRRWRLLVGDRLRGPRPPPRPSPPSLRPATRRLFAAGNHHGASRWRHLGLGLLRVLAWRCRPNRLRCVGWS